MKTGSRIVRLVLTGALFFGAYLLLVLQVSADELLAGALVGSVAAGLLEAIRAQTQLEFRLRIAWFGVLLRRVPGQAWADCVLLARGLFARQLPVGELRAVPFDGERGEPNEAAGRRALVVVGASLSPNSVVIAVDAASRRLLVHQLVPTAQPPGGGDELWPL